MQGLSLLIGGIVIGIKPLGEALGQAAFEVVNFFTDTIPNAYNKAIAWIGGAVDSVKGFFVGLWDSTKSMVVRIANGFVSFFSPVINFYTSVSR